MDLLEHKNTNKYVESQEKETNMLNAKIFGLLPFFTHITYDLQIINLIILMV